MSTALNELRQYVSGKETLDKKGASNRISRFIDGNRQECQWYWSEAEFSHLYVGGRQWPVEIYNERLKEERAALVVNKTEVAIDSFTGNLQTDRFQASVMPENYEEPIAGPLNQVVQEQRRRAGGRRTSTEVFRDMWIGRVGCQHISPYQDGQSLMERRVVIPIWEMMWDTKSREQNFTDRRGHVHGRYINAYDFRAMFPKEETDRFFKIWSSPGRDEKISGWPLNVENVYHQTDENVWLYSHEWRETERCVYLKLPGSIDQQVLANLAGDIHTDETVLDALAVSMVGMGAAMAQAQSDPPAKLGWTLNEKDFGALEQVYFKVASTEIPLSFYRRLTRERYYKADFVGNQLVGKVRLIPEQKFTFLFMTDKLIKTAQSGHRPRSYIRGMQDQQTAMNRALAGRMDDASRSIKNALLVTEGFFKNPAKAQEQLSAPGAVVICQQPPQEGVNYKLMQTKPNPVWSEIYSDLTAIWAEEIIAPHETGGQQDMRRVSARALAAVTQSARGKHGSRYEAYSTMLAEEVVLTIHQLHAYYEYEEALDIVGPGYSRPAVDPTTGEAIEEPLLPSDRRLWLHALRRQVSIVETPYTETERDDLFTQLNETGYWQTLAQMLPPEVALEFMVELTPANLASSSPKAFAKLREAVELLKQQQAQQQQTQPEQPPPGGQPN